jgi:NADH-quinone oxidoreductase subunit M
MNYLHFPWLELSIATPLVGAALVHCFRDADAARKYGVAICLIALVLTTAAWIDLAMLGASAAHDPSPIHRLLGDRGLVIDELSAPMLPLAALLYLLTAVATLRTKVRRYSFSWSLVSLGLLLATLSCQHPWGIIGLLAAATVPPYLELKARHKPTGVYASHMALFVVLLAAGWLLVAWEGEAAAHSWWVILPLLGAICIRGGFIPVHCWLTDLFEHATFGTALMVATPIAGAYAALRLVFPIAPVWVLQSIGVLSLATAFYAAGMALVQREARRFFCFLFLSHSALVFAGLESATVLGLTGALCMWLSVALSLTGFGLTLRALEARRGRLSLVEYHGVYEHTPGLAICFLLTGLASVGFPGTFGFIGAELLIDGAVQAYPYLGVTVAIVAALNGIAVVRAYFILFTGTPHVSSVSLQIRGRERLAVLTLAALILGGGIYPQPGVVSRHHAASALLQSRTADRAVAGQEELDLDGRRVVLEPSHPWLGNGETSQ